MKTKICEYSECKLEYIPAKFGFTKYCSSVCKSRANQQRHGRAAKELICTSCKKPFKRKSARDLRCVECRTPKAPNGSLAQQYPVMDREIEKDLIQQWIDNPKNEIKVA